MGSLVLELQQKALDSSVSVTELLRLVKVVAVKLGMTELEEWVQCETEGYGDNEVPEYRVLSGMPRFWNPYYGWCPIMSEDPEYAKLLSTRKSDQPIGEIEEFSNSDPDGILEMPYPTFLEARLAKETGGLRPSLHISRVEVGSVVEAVRNRILDWALKLESEGILGEGVAFSSKEKEIAAEQSEGLVINIGNMVNSQFQQGNVRTSMDVASGPTIEDVQRVVSMLKDNVQGLGITTEAESELAVKIEELEKAMDVPEPEPSRLSAGLMSINNILEGAAGNLAASGILYELGKLCG